MKLLVPIALAIIVLTACSPAPTLPPPTATRAPQPTAPVVNLPPLSTTTPTTMTDTMLVVYHKSGGIAGINEILTVYQDGKVELVDTRQNYRGEARAELERIAKLKELIAKPEYANLQSVYQAMGADLFVYRISTRASDGKVRTVTTMDAAQHPDVLTQVISELNALRKLVQR